MVKHHKKCWKCSPFCSRYMFTIFLTSKMFCNPFVNASCLIASGTPDCWGNFVKDVCGFCTSSRLKSWTTSSDTEDLLPDFPLLTLTVRTNLLVTFLMWASNDVSWIIKSRPDILAYKRLQNTQTLTIQSSLFESVNVISLVLPKIDTKISSATTTISV